MQYHEALFLARERKFYDKKEAEYWVRVNSANEIKPFTASELGARLIAQFEATNKLKFNPTGDDMVTKNFNLLCDTLPPIQISRNTVS